MLTFYILMWPIMSAVVLAIIVYTFTKELREAKRTGKKVV
ncbi:putative transporter small subunit [Pelagibius sp. Alg239-R121]|nr:putative transporter small subunit [Pelagibius sp. Alg239-R121]